MNPKVDFFFDQKSQWQLEYQKLRSIVIDCGLNEALKWKQPCYTFKSGNPSKRQTNVLMIVGFKDFCGISFLKGVLLNDSNQLLQKPGEQSQSVRFLKFTSLDQIEAVEQIIKSYIYEAIELEKAGIEVVLKKTTEPIPEELSIKFTAFPELKTAFDSLTTGKQRGYLLYFSGPKSSTTKISRIENYTSKIMSGKGFHDCTCGLSKRKPNCDGSHKLLIKQSNL
jgi:uncharacterized protein YdeI (YjbR/CyaY-like superfamily)